MSEKITSKHRESLRREAAREAVAEERERMRREIRYEIQEATKGGQNATVAWWLAVILRKLES